MRDAGLGAWGLMILLAFILGVTTPAPVQVATLRIGGPAIVDPVWLSRPGRDEIDAAWRAQTEALTGGPERPARVSLGCWVGADGRLEHCAVAGEVRPDSRAARAALALTGLYRMRERSFSDQATRGGRVELQVVFRR